MNDTISAGLRARVALEKHGFRFTHSLGQNFLLDDSVVAGLVQAADVQEGENVLEIGPGAGVMTAALLNAGARVLAVELDKSIVPVLSEVTGESDRLTVLLADALKLDIGAATREAFGGAPYRVVANLPYYITADCVERLLTASHRPESVCIMVQKEAAERMTSLPGGKQWCALAATIRYFAEAETLATLPGSAFTPPPHVTSCFLGLTLYKEKPVSALDEALLLRVIGAAFAMRRKTLANNLASAFPLTRERAVSVIAECGLRPDIRGEALSVAELCRLTDALQSALQPPPNF